MRLLIDTHVLLWAVDDPARLSPAAAAAVQNPENDLLVGAGTVWELAIKVGLGKLSLSMPYRPWVEQACTDLGIAILPITVAYADRQAGLPYHHGDPFDRLLIAQSLEDAIAVVTADAAFDAYGVTRVW